MRLSSTITLTISHETNDHDDIPFFSRHWISKLFQTTEWSIAEASINPNPGKDNPGKEASRRGTPSYTLSRRQVWVSIPFATSRIIVSPRYVPYRVGTQRLCTHVSLAQVATTYEAASSSENPSMPCIRGMRARERVRVRSLTL